MRMFQKKDHQRPRRNNSPPRPRAVSVASLLESTSTASSAESSVKSATAVSTRTPSLRKAQLSGANSTATRVAKLLAEQEEISNFFCEASSRMAAVVEESNNNKDATKMKQVCVLMKRMAEKQQKLALKVANIALKRSPDNSNHHQHFEDTTVSTALTTPSRNMKKSIIDLNRVESIPFDECSDVALRLIDGEEDYPLDDDGTPKKVAFFPIHADTNSDEAEHYEQQDILTDFCGANDVAEAAIEGIMRDIPTEITLSEAFIDLFALVQQDDDKAPTGENISESSAVDQAVEELAATEQANVRLLL